MTYSRERYLRDREGYLRRSKIWQKNNREHVYKVRRKWRKNNPDKINLYAKKYRIKYRDKIRKRENAHLQKLRIKALTYYGGVPPECRCCKEKYIEFLSLDHINGGGNKHREKIKRSIWFWLQSKNYPKGFQVLCHNCNSAKAFYKRCPHENN